MAGGESVTGVCRDLGIGLSTIYQWQQAQPAFAERYARAREYQAEAFGAQVIDIADGANELSYQQARLRVDARKWYASKMYPRVFGDRQQLDVKADVQTTSTLDLTKLSAEELRLLLDLQQKASAEEADS